MDEKQFNDPVWKPSIQQGDTTFTFNKEIDMGPGKKIVLFVWPTTAKQQIQTTIVPINASSTNDDDFVETITAAGPSRSRRNVPQQQQQQQQAAAASTSGTSLQGEGASKMNNNATGSLASGEGDSRGLKRQYENFWKCQKKLYTEPLPEPLTREVSVQIAQTSMALSLVYVAANLVV